MTYTIKHSNWQWLIEPTQAGKYVLKYKRPMLWKECRSFRTAEAAANAVAKGNTGIKGWDILKREKPFPSLSEWLIDPADAVLSAASQLIRTTLLSPEAPAG